MLQADFLWRNFSRRESSLSVLLDILVPVLCDVPIPTYVSSLIHRIVEVRVCFSRSYEWMRAALASWLCSATIALCVHQLFYNTIYNTIPLKKYHRFICAKVDRRRRRSSDDLATAKLHRPGWYFSHHTSGNYSTLNTFQVLRSSSSQNNTRNNGKATAAGNTRRLRVPEHGVALHNYLSVHVRHLANIIAWK